MKLWCESFILLSVLTARVAAWASKSVELCTDLPDEELPQISFKSAPNQSINWAEEEDHKTRIKGQLSNHLDNLQSATREEADYVDAMQEPNLSENLISHQFDNKNANHLPL